MWTPYVMLDCSPALRRSALHYEAEEVAPHAIDPQWQKLVDQLTMGCHSFRLAV